MKKTAFERPTGHLNISQSKKILEKEANPVVIELQNVSKVVRTGGIVKKKTKIILDNISFQIRRNEHTAILGANGAGKTTLVEIICGLNKPTSGKIFYNLGSTNFKSKIGVQFQETSYPSNLSVADVVKFVTKLYNISLTNNPLLKKLIDIFEIKKIYHKNITFLSGGEAQRVNVMLSLFHKPEILFLDELSTGLDIKIRTRIKHFIKNYADQNKITIIIVSHDVEEIGYITNHIIFLKNGQKVIDTTKDLLIREYGSFVNFFDKSI